MRAVSRRRFLGVASGALAGVGSLALLEACGQVAPPAEPAPAATAAGATNAAHAVTPPTYVPFQGPTPDFPASADGVVPAGYLTYPSQLVQSVSQAPGKGGDITAFTFTYQAEPPGPDRNAAWAQVNKELNANLQITAVANVDYFTSKLPTLLAGNDLPDMFLLSWLTTNIPNELQVLQRLCADLTPYLSGDAVRAYPNLANLPPYTWKNGILDNKMYMTPIQPGGLAGTSALMNLTLLEPLGMASFSSADDFLRKAQDVTQPGTRYMLGGGYLSWFLNVFRVPNQWRNDQGKLTRDIETDEYKAMVAYLRKLWDAGVVHPDTPTLTSNLVEGGNNWDNGRYALWFGGFTNYQLAWHNAVTIDPTFRPHLLVPFPHDGQGKAVQNFGQGAYASIALKKASPDRIREVLGVLNYLSAPFGTREAHLLRYGVENTDFVFDARGNPALTNQGKIDMTVPWQNLGTSPQVLYDATNPEFTSATYTEMSEILALGVPLPTAGLYSATNATKGGALQKTVNDAVNNIIWGRDPVSALDQIIQDWRANGGDQIRQEYEQALAAAAA